jgi:uncharacterized membrane protein YkoI
MPVSRLSIFAFALLSGLLRAGPVLAANLQEHSCLSKAEQRLVVASHKAVPLAGIMKSRRAQGHHGELVRAKLCRQGDDLVYMLTLLGRSGRVVNAAVDAASGAVINAR